MRSKIEESRTTCIVSRKSDDSGTFSKTRKRAELGVRGLRSGRIVNLYIMNTEGLSDQLLASLHPRFSENSLPH